MTKSKVMLIGWDSADWKIINPLLEAGLMPNLKRMVEGGTMGYLSSLEPSFSPMLWTSISTGKHAYKHGILGFTEVNHDEKSIRPVLSSSRKAKAIWEILSYKQFNCHSVGWWPSHPAEKINGIAISNFYQKDTGKLSDPWIMPNGTVSPEELTEHFSKLRIHPGELTGQHILPFIPRAESIDQESDPRVYTVAKITAHAASIQAAFTNIIRNNDWDFASVYFDSLDHYSHAFMKFHPPKQKHIRQDLFDLYHNVVTSGYKFHDMLLGRLMELAPKDTTIILISDHGFHSDHLRPINTPQEPGGLAFEHSPYGIFCAMGPNIKQDALVHGANILDICPTILNIYDLPIGKDMDGKVLSSIFESEKEVKYINTWEAIPFSSIKHSEISEKSERIMLQQLVNLGYIDPLMDDMSKEIEKTKTFNTSNLAKSLIQAGKVEDAYQLYKQLFNDNPLVPRYAYQLALCSQILGKFSECNQLIKTLRENQSIKTHGLDLLEASILHSQGRFLEAIEIYKQVLEKSQNNELNISFNLGKCYLSMGDLESAIAEFSKIIKLDNTHSKAHKNLGIALYIQNNFETSLNEFLMALSLEYNDSISHLYAGLNLMALGHYSESVDHLEVALVINPDLNIARKHLVTLYKTHLGNQNKAAFHKASIKNTYKGEIYVVSGLPRSGTSLMMNMIKEGGVEIFSDNVRLPSKDNPNGFFEHDVVKSLPFNKKWLSSSKNKCVKIISSLLFHLPENYKYKVIFMERDLLEICDSQIKMLDRNQIDHRHTVLSFLPILKEEIRKVKNMINKANHIDALFINYRDVLNDPFGTSMNIANFFNLELDLARMAGVADNSLYRSRFKSEILITTNPINK